MTFLPMPYGAVRGCNEKEHLPCHRRRMRKIRIGSIGLTKGLCGPDARRIVDRRRIVGGSRNLVACSGDRRAPTSGSYPALKSLLLGRAEERQLVARPVIPRDLVPPPCNKACGSTWPQPRCVDRNWMCEVDGLGFEHDAAQAAPPKGSIPNFLMRDASVVAFTPRSSAAPPSP